MLCDANIPLSLYVHFPWCIKKCPYCDFNSHTLRGILDEKNYVIALLKDLDFELQHTNISRPLTSIFFGGGTPSLFSAESLQFLLSEIQQRIDFTEQIEITMEANPGAVEHDAFRGYRDAGINRLSIGAQTFDTTMLKALGRIHSPSEIVNAVNAAQRAGFDNLNIDLMFALPGQHLEDALSDLQQAMDLSPQHMSCYQLTLEPNTLFHRFPPQLPNQDLALEMQTAIFNKLNDHGFNQYEVSAFATDSRKCQHNLNYWQFGDYLGIGAGAHGKLTTKKQILRHHKNKHPQTYINILNVKNTDAQLDSIKISEPDISFEFALNALRLKDGFNQQLYEQRTGLNWGDLISDLQQSIEENLLVLENSTLRCSDKGYLFIDHILQSLLPASQ